MEKVKADLKSTIENIKEHLAREEDRRVMAEDEIKKANDNLHKGYAVLSEYESALEVLELHTLLEKDSGEERR